MIRTKYIVKYAALGGSDAPSTQYKKGGETLVLSSEIPTRSGYNLLGWDINETANTVVYNPGDDYDVDASITLYAVWEKKIITSLSLNTTSIAIVEEGEGKEITFTASPTDAEVEYRVQDATYSNGVYKINGLEIIISGKKATIKATSYQASSVQITFVEKNSGLSKKLIVNVSEKPTEPTKEIVVNVLVVKTSGKKAQYKVYINVNATNTTIIRVQYSLNNGKKWQTGTSFTSKSNVTSLLIRVVDGDGVTYNYSYSNGKVVEK